MEEELNDHQDEHVEQPAELEDEVSETEQAPASEDLAAAQKLRREAQSLRKRLREQEDELAKFREAQMSETERAVAEARREAEEGMRAEVLRSRLREAAAGRLANPADAVVFCDVTNVDIDDETTLAAEISRVLDERPYLAAQQQPQVIDQGPRTSPKPAPTFQEYMAQQLGKL